MQRQRDVAEPAPARDAARAAVDRRRQAAAVEEQDRLAALLRDPAELLEQRRRERVAGLATQVDDPDARHRRAEPLAELEPLQPLPALRPRRRAAVDGDRALERGALGRDRARVVARVGLLLVGRVVLLVDADQAEVRHRREDRGARADDDRRLAGDDPLPLVAALRLGQAGVEHRDPVAEARLEAPERLRRQRDLRDEHDRALPALERGRAGLEIDLRLAAAGRAGEQEVRAVAVERLDDPRDRPLLRRRQLRRLGLSGHAGAGRPPLAAPDAQLRRHELERARRRRAVVVGEPERELDERRRQLVEDALDRGGLHPGRRLDTGRDHDPACSRAAEADRDDRADADVLRHLVRERPRDRAGGHERIDLGEAHRATVTAREVV